jgi:predicted ester cyclase
MQEAILEQQDISIARKNLEEYFNTHDVKFITEDAVFTSMNTGDETVGREAVGQMLNYFYHVAFDAKAEITNKIITEKKALLEFNFVGKHIGEFAGIQPTNKEVNVPTCISYDVENGLIKKARIYMLIDVLMKQLQ